MGSDAIALPMLEWAWREGRATAEIVGVFTQPDRPSGRGQKLTANAIKLWAIEHGLPVFQPEKLTTSSLADLRALAPDTVLVMAYGHILRKEWLDAPRCGMWNVHTSLLPKFRGASPIQGALLAGENETGVCLMRMALALDAGPALDVERVQIAPLETAATLETKLSAACVPLIARNFASLFDRTPQLTPQDHALATFTRRMRKEDGRLDFAAPSAVIAHRINALYPWPGAYFEFGGETIKVGLAEPTPQSAPPQPPGTVLPSAGTGALVVAAGDGAVRLLRLQRPGGRMLPAADFLRGHPIVPGTAFTSFAMTELVSTRPIK